MYSARIKIRIRISEQERRTYVDRKRHLEPIWTHSRTHGTQKAMRRRGRWVTHSLYARVYTQGVLASHAGMRASVRPSALPHVFRRAVGLFAWAQEQALRNQNM